MPNINQDATTELLTDTVETALNMGIKSPDNVRLRQWHEDMVAAPRSELALPWPKRMENGGHTTMTSAFLPARLLPWIEDRGADGFSIERAMALLEKASPFTKNVEALNKEAFRAAMTWALYKKSPHATILTISRQLFSMMALVDIDDKMPTQYLAAPFDVCYLEFGSLADRQQDLTYLPNGRVMGQSTRIEGALIHYRQGKAGSEMTAGYRQHMGWEEGDDIKLLDIRFYECPLAAHDENRRHVTNDMHFRITFPWRDDEMEFGPLFERVVSWYSEFNAELMGDVTWLRELAGVVAKVLLLLHTKQASLVTAADGDEAMARILRLEGAAKRRKAEQRARSAYNHIRIDLDMPEGWVTGHPAGIGTGKVTAHWRRGHFHTYWVGKGRTDRLVKLLKPVLVNANLEKEAPRAKEYRLDL